MSSAASCRTRYIASKLAIPCGATRLKSDLGKTVQADSRAHARSAPHTSPTPLRHAHTCLLPQRSVGASLFAVDAGVAVIAVVAVVAAAPSSPPCAPRLRRSSSSTRRSISSCAPHDASAYVVNERALFVRARTSGFVSHLALPLPRLLHLEAQQRTPDAPEEDHRDHARLHSLRHRRPVTTDPLRGARDVARCGGQRENASPSISSSTSHPRPPPRSPRIVLSP